MKLHRSIVRIPQFAELEYEAQSNVRRMQRVVEATRGSISDHHMVRSNWLAMAGEQLAHPLARHALERNGSPDYHEGRSVAERCAVATNSAAAALAALHLGDSASFGDRVQRLATEIGVIAPRLRSGTTAIAPDRLGCRIEFPDQSLIEDRFATLSEYISTSMDPLCLKAMVFQVAFLNMHPLSDGNGRVSRVIFNKIIWKEDAGARFYLPLYELRKHAPFSFELSLRSAEIHDSWAPLTKFYADFVEIYCDFVKGCRE